MTDSLEEHIINSLEEGKDIVNVSLLRSKDKE